MANKKIFRGMLAAALVLSMVLAGCENGAQEVEGKVNITYPQIEAPSVTETKTTDGMYLILSWKAVENAGDYTVFRNQKDKKTVSEIYNAATNTVVYQADGTTKPNADSDNWNAAIPLLEAVGTTTTKEYRFGVNSVPLVFDSQTWRESSIAWGTTYTPSVVHPYTALIGTWIKQGSTTGPMFAVSLSGGGGDPLDYLLVDANGAQLSYGTFSTDYSSTPGFSGYYYDYVNYTNVTFAAALSTATTLTVSSLDTTINGIYTKQ